MTHVWTHDRSHSGSAARRLVPGLLGAVSLAIGATGALAASVEKSSYGATKAGEAVDVYTLKNDNGATVKFISYGGIITDIDVPDRWGRVGNVVLGFKNLADYETKNPYFGALIGRYGNRIGAAKFTLNGAEYKLAANNGPNSLHGGNKGFDKVVWKVEPLQSADGSAAARLHVSEQGR